MYPLLTLLHSHLNGYFVKRNVGQDHLLLTSSLSVFVGCILWVGGMVWHGGDPLVLSSEDWIVALAYYGAD